MTCDERCWLCLQITNCRQAAGRDPLDLDDDQPRTMLQAAHHPNVQHLMAEESMKPLKCPSPVTVAAAHIAAKHGMAVKMRGTMGSPAGQAPGDSEASGGENDATFFVFEDDKENVDPKTGVSARLSSGAGSRSGARLDDPFPRGRFLGRDFGIFWLFAKRLAREELTRIAPFLPPQTSLRSRSGFPGTPRGSPRRRSGLRAASPSPT